MFSMFSIISSVLQFGTCGFGTWENPTKLIHFVARSPSKNEAVKKILNLNTVDVVIAFASLLIASSYLDAY